MTRSPVQSSNILSVGYDPEDATLEIEFKGGGVYRYSDVPPDAYQEFVAADSLGRHFAAHIKKQFKCQRVVLLPVLIAGEPHQEAAP